MKADGQAFRSQSSVGMKNLYSVQDSLSGNCLTHLLACIYPTSRNCRECLSTLQFALRCVSVKTSPHVNTITAPSKSPCDANSNALIAELTKEVSDLQQELDSTHVSPFNHAVQLHIFAGTRTRCCAMTVGCTSGTLSSAGSLPEASGTISF